MIKGNVPLNPAPVREPKNIFGGENMKKYAWIVALLVALSFGFIGCDDKDKEPPETKPGEPVKTLRMADNFQYGEGYQGLIDGIIKRSNNLTGDTGGKIGENEQYTLKITFTASRELENELKIGLVDRSPVQSPPRRNYWWGLSWDSAADDDDRVTISKEEINAGEVTKIITFTTVAGALSVDDAANCLVFETDGEGQGPKTTGKEEGIAGSGVKKPFDLIFTVFQFVKGTEADLPVGPVEPEPEGAKFPVTFGEDDTEILGATDVNVDYVEGGYEVDYNGKNYANAYAYFAVDFGEKELADYETVSFTYTGVSGDSDWKYIVLLASADEFTGNLGDDTAVNVITYSIGNKQVRETGTDVVLNINRLKASLELEGESELYLALYIGAGNCKFTITDVVFTEALDAIPAAITPVASDFEFTWDAPPRTQVAGATPATPITLAYIKPSPGKSHGTISNLKFGTSTTFPTTAGTYAITFDVAAAPGWNAATGLSLGDLVLTEPLGALTLKRTIDEDSEATIWSWKANDPPNDTGIKGKLTAAVSSEILGYTGEVRIYWEYTGVAEGGIGAGWGIGEFGEGSSKEYKSGAGGMSGMATMLISGLQADASGELFINPMNDCSVIKIEILAEE